jgi:Uma2 family endonuclease
VTSHSVTKLTEEQYLTLERASEFKSEYFDGEMFAMSGGSMQHARLQQNLTTELSIALRGGRCEAFGSDLRVRVSSRMYTYPDISVVCGKPLLADDRQDVLLNPVAVFEVLSPSTEKYDRGLKLQRYRTITTLQDYILVSQSELRIEQYTRQENNLWVLRDCESLDDELNIASIGVSLPLRRLYDRVEFPECP